MGLISPLFFIIQDSTARSYHRTVFNHLYSHLYSFVACSPLCRSLPPPPHHLLLVRILNRVPSWCTHVVHLQSHISECNMLRCMFKRVMSMVFTCLESWRLWGGKSIEMPYIISCVSCYERFSEGMYLSMFR